MRLALARSAAAFRRLSVALPVALLASLWIVLAGHAAEDNAVVAESLRTIFQSGKADMGSAKANADLDAIRDIYVVRDFKPIWVRDQGPKTKARALLSELKISGVNGLSPAFYHVADIEALKPYEKVGIEGVIVGKSIYMGTLDLAEAIEIAAKED